MSMSATSFLLVLLSFCAHATVQGSLLTPFATSDPRSDLVSNSQAQTQMKPPQNLKPGLEGTRAIPTNKWWGNLIHRDDFQKSQPIYTSPYRLEFELDVEPYGLHIAYPVSTRAMGPVNAEGELELNAQGGIRFYIHGLGVQDLVFTSEALASTLPSVEVSDWDELGVHVSMFATNNPSQKITSYLTLGMAFITTTYLDNMRPQISSSHAIVSVNGQTSATTTSSKIVVKMNNGQSWALYSSRVLTWSRVSGSKWEVLDDSVSGPVTIQAALLNSDFPDTQYDAFADCQLVGTSLETDSASSYDLRWQTTGACRQGLLHLALPHHNLDLAVVAPVPEIALVSPTKGPMRGFRTLSFPRRWHMKEDEDVQVEFYPPTPAPMNLMTEYRVAELLAADIDALWSLPKRGSYYFTGKAALKYANLCLMARDTNVVNDSDVLASKCIAKLQQEFGNFLNNAWEFPLIYDNVYRGISSSAAFAQNDPWVDFGNSVFNDHHYHYGYWITASAILKHLDPAWTQLSKLESMVENLLRDVVNPSTADVYFPTFRHFDWYAGHSYSHGVTPFSDGKDLESTSEEMNLYYGLYLWGKTSNVPSWQNLGELMMKVNKRSINTYFLMQDDNEAHPPEFIKNKVMGIYFDNKVDYATWFCGEPECIHGIQMIPASPINEFFRPIQFVQEEWDQVLRHIPLLTDPGRQSPWQSLLYANVAAVDKSLALAKLSTVPMDDGLTRSWALYYAATRPDGTMNPTPATPTPVTPAPTTTPTPTPAPTTPTTPTPTSPTPAPTTPTTPTPTSPTPAPTTPTTPTPTYPTPAPTTPAPTTPGQSYAPTPVQSYAPTPGQSYTPTPGQSYTPAPGQSYAPAPGPYSPYNPYKSYAPATASPYRPYDPTTARPYVNAPTPTPVSIDQVTPVPTTMGEPPGTTTDNSTSISNNDDNTATGLSIRFFPTALSWMLVGMMTRHLMI